MKNLSRKIDRIQRLIAPLINVGGKHEVEGAPFDFLVEAQTELDKAFRASEFPEPPLFEKADWACSNPKCEWVAEQADGAPHRCPKCLSTDFTKTGVIGGDPEPDKEEDDDKGS